MHKTQVALKFRCRDQGFALVVTLLLMVLLAIIAVGLLSLSSIALRTSSRTKDMAEAQCNARLGLMIAIGQIQTELGKDQVATAQATILAAGPTGGGNIPPPNSSSPASEYSNVKNPHWLAAFPTYDPAASTPKKRLFHIRRPSDTTPGGELYLYDARYCNPDMTPKNNWEWVRAGSSGTEVQWLVSNPNPTIQLQADQLTPTSLVGTSADFATTPSSGTYRGPLLYPAAATHNAPALATIEARAPIVPLKDSSGNYKGSYAYMVSDDSLKYKISLQHSVHQTPANAPTKSDGTTYAQLLSPQNTHLEGLYLNGGADQKLRKLEYDSNTSSIKNITLSTLPLQSGDATFSNQPASYFTPYYQHTFTSNGYGLLTDPVSGGLKRNLTSYLERPSQGAMKNQRIDAIHAGSASEWGAPNGIVQDSVSDTSSLLFCLEDRDRNSNSVTPGSMTTYSDPEQRLTWYAPVFGLLRDYAQLRNPPTGPNPAIEDPVLEPRAPSQAKDVFMSNYGNTHEGFDGMIRSTNEPSAMTSWDTGSHRPFMPGSGDQPNLAPSKGIHPILVKAAAYMYPSYNKDEKTTAFLVYPRIILYNPYNVKLAGRKYVVSIKRNTVTFASYCQYTFGTGTTAKKVNMFFDISNGNEIEGTLAGNQRDLVFLVDNEREGMMPGESLLFCPDPTRGTDLRGGGKYARLFKASDPGSTIDKMVLTSTFKPSDGTAFYMNGPSFPEWGSGSASQSTVSIYSGSNSSGPHGLAKRMIKLFLPAAGTSLSYPLNDSLSNLSLLQAVEAVGRYEVNTFNQCPIPAPNALAIDSVPMFSSLTTIFGDPSQLDLRWLHGGWLGMRLVRGNEIPGGTCIAGSDQYSLLKQYDIRSNYVGHTYDVGLPPSMPRRMPNDAARNFYGSESNLWVWSCDGTSATMSDPLHVLAGDPPISTSQRTGLNTMSAFMRTGTISANTANSYLFEVPRRNVPLISLGGFQNAHLNSFVGAPTYMIGNSYGTRLAPRSGSAAAWAHLQNSYKFTHWTISGGKGTLLTWFNYCVPYAGTLKSLVTPFHYQIYDHSYEMNHSLWDRFFLTGVEGDPSSGELSPAATSLPSDPSDPTRLDVSKKLPNPRLIANSFGQKPPLKKDLVSYFKASENLVVDGAFNVNCTDPLAWQALLASFRKINPPVSSGGTLNVGNDSSFSRLLTPPLERNGVPTGLVGSSPIWSQVRCLTDAQIETLSNLIVEQVKQRAPFISVSDFVNRRLLGGDPSSGILGPAAETVITKWGLKGPLQTAIDDSGINGFLPSPTTADPWYAPPAAPATINAYSPTNAKGDMSSGKYADALGYLTQGDILAKIGSVLTTRGDTFTIRAYGDSRDPSGNILASARCEATIQRIPEYVDNLADPLPQACFANLNSDINRKFGRKFIIIAFRWLNSNE